jgi:hypothetical protein
MIEPLSHLQRDPGGDHDALGANRQSRSGSIRPKVVRVALENAVSVASALLLTEVTLTEVPEEKHEGARTGGLPEE